MTKEDILDHFKDINHAYNECTRYDDIKRMLDELESDTIVLDKIRAEVEDVAFDLQEIDGEHESFVVVDLNDVLHIIDKYKTKSEET